MIKQTAITVIGAAVLATSAQAGAAAEAGAPVLSSFNSIRN